MASTFFVVGLPASFTTEQLRQVLGTVAPELKSAEMLPDTVATGVGFVQMANTRAGLKAAERLLSKSVRYSLAVRPLICQDHTGAFHAISKRWQAERVSA